MSTLNIARWEWFKLQRRRMPWILLGILFLFSELAVLGSYAAYSGTAAGGGRVMVPIGIGTPGVRMASCREVLEDPAAIMPAGAPEGASAALLEQCRRQASQLAIRHASISAAGGMTSTLGVASSLGLVLFGILAASVVGVEFGLGTLRPILARGTGRLTFLGGKYLVLVAASTAALVLVCAITAATGQLLHGAAPPPPGDALPAASLASTGLPLLKTWYAMLTYVTLAGALTVLLRSTAAGMGISLAWYVAEPLLIRLLSEAFDGFTKVADYLPMRNISALTSAGRPGLANLLSGGGNVTAAHACLVMGAWLVALAAMAALVFRNRDVTGAVGG